MSPNSAPSSHRTDRPAESEVGTRPDPGTPERTATLLVSACGQSVTASPQASGAATASVASCGTAHDYKTDPQRAVVLSGGQADLLARLGAAEHVTGVAQLNGVRMPKEFAEKKVPVISESIPPNRGTLLKAQPDLVLAPTACEFSAEQGFATQEQLAKAGAQVYVAAAGCPDSRSKAQVEDLFSDVTAYGAIFGKEKESSALVEQGKKVLAEAKERAEKGAASSAGASGAGTSGTAKPKVAQLFIDGGHLTAVEHDIALKAGAEPVFSPTDKEFSSFFAAEVGAEAFVLTAASKAQEQQAREYLQKHLANMPAVKNGEIIVVSSDKVLPGSWGAIEAVEQISKALYPGKQRLPLAQSVGRMAV